MPGDTDPSLPRVTSASPDRLRAVIEPALAAHEETETLTLKGLLRWRVALVAAGAVLVGPFLAGISAVSFAQTKMDAAVSKRADVLEASDASTVRRVEVLEQGVRELQRQAIEKEARDAQRFDVLYGTMLSGRRDPRAAELAKLPDGGTP